MLILYLILKNNNLLNFLIEGMQEISYQNINSLNKLPKELIIRIAY